VRAEENPEPKIAPRFDFRRFFDTIDCPPAGEAAERQLGA
jgi:hypothetical protein